MNYIVRCVYENKKATKECEFLSFDEAINFSVSHIGENMFKISIFLREEDDRKEILSFRTIK